MVVGLKCELNRMGSCRAQNGCVMVVSGRLIHKDMDLMLQVARQEGIHRVR